MSHWAGLCRHFLPFWTAPQQWDISSQNIHSKPACTGRCTRLGAFRPHPINELLTIFVRATCEGGAKFQETAVFLKKMRNDY